MEGFLEWEVLVVVLVVVLKYSLMLLFESIQVWGYDFNCGVDYCMLLKVFGIIGFQVINFGCVVQ